ncbi:hypothetical protein QLX08_004372 [Tetragonisca angustula]|uniref:Retrotransposon gag domain-containing protein n=1 Tax=Tetragonisca angustula TaxID=166442 RepID=A0AAW1A4X9_9HYME
MVKLLIGSRLKGNALEWLHSKPEYVSMPLDELLGNLREMFYHPENVLVARRKFEARVWNREEPFSEYLHEKVILGNRVPINEFEIIEYIIEGIPDPALRDLARAQRIKTKKDLLESFERITLRGPNMTPSRFQPRKTEEPEERTDERGAEERVLMLQLRRIRPCNRELSIEERRP